MQPALGDFGEARTLGPLIKSQLLYQLSYEVVKKKSCIEQDDLSDPDWIQTNDPQLRRLLLYSTELPGLAVAQN